jgi:hypothetical protein
MIVLLQNAAPVITAGNESPHRLQGIIFRSPCSLRISLLPHDFPQALGIFVLQFFSKSLLQISQVQVFNTLQHLCAGRPVSKASLQFSHFRMKRSVDRFPTSPSLKPRQTKMNLQAGKLQRSTEDANPSTRSTSALQVHSCCTNCFSWFEQFLTNFFKKFLAIQKSATKSLLSSLKFSLNFQKYFQVFQKTAL